MKTINCFNCRFEWIRIVLFVGWLIAGTVVLAIACISVLEDRLVGETIVIRAAAVILTFLPVQMWFVWRSQKACAAGQCRCGCHPITLCRGTHHHWCDPDRDYSRIETGITRYGPTDPEDFCGHCAYRHREDRFKIIQYDSQKYRCDCACHEKAWAMPRAGVCTCHRWCLKIRRIS